MPRGFRGRRRSVGLAVAGVGLLGTLTIILVAQGWIGRDHNAEATDAYSHGDWEKTSLLARGGSSRLPRIPGRCDWPLERPRGRTATSGRSRSTLDPVRLTWRPSISSSSARPWVGRARRNRQ